MTRHQQNHTYLAQYLAMRDVAPWIARLVEDKIRACLNAMGGMLGSWRDYPRCLYIAPQLIGGELVDLSTPEKVDTFFEGRKS